MTAYQQFRFGMAVALLFSFVTLALHLRALQPWGAEWVEATRLVAVAAMGFVLAAIWRDR